MCYLEIKTHNLCSLRALLHVASDKIRKTVHKSDPEMDAYLYFAQELSSIYFLFTDFGTHIGKEVLPLLKCYRTDPNP